MKQLTYIFILFISLAFQNCTNPELTIDQVEKDSNHSRSMTNITIDNCLESDGILKDKKKSDAKSVLQILNNNQNVSRFPSLKNATLEDTENIQNGGERQAIFDDFDPESI